LVADFVDKKGRVETDLKLLRLEPPLPFLMRRRDIRQYLFLNISERLEVQTWDKSMYMKIRRGDKWRMIEIKWRIPPSYLTCHYSIDNIKNKSFKV
jgi:hypothetical protein